MNSLGEASHSIDIKLEPVFALGRRERVHGWISHTVEVIFVLEYVQHDQASRLPFDSC